MVTQNILETQIVKVNPKNTGLLSKVDDTNKNNKYGLNPLFTILNKDFNKQFKEDYNKQRIREDKQGKLFTHNDFKPIITKKYIENKQKDILRLFEEVYPEDHEEKLNYCLQDTDTGKPKLTVFQNGLDDITRSLNISISDVEAYLKRGGFESFVISSQARPEVLVFDFDNFITPEEVEQIKKTFRKYLYLIEYKENNGHLHLYIKSTFNETINYSNTTKKILLKDKENQRVNIDIFKNAKRVTANCTPYNEYEIIYDEKPKKTIKVRNAIRLLANLFDYTVNTQFLEEVLNPKVMEVPQTEGSTEDHTGTPTQYNSNYYDTITTPKDTPQTNKETIIEEATPIFNYMDKSHQRETLYRSLTGALLKHGYKEKTIESIIVSIEKGTPDRENRISSVRSCFKGQKKGDHLYRWNNFKELVLGYTKDPKIIEHLQKLSKTIYEHDKEERTENMFYHENNITPRETELMKQYINTIDNTLTLLQGLNTPFTNYLTNQLTHILRHCNLDNETIKQIIDPEKYSYNLYEPLSKTVNEKTQIVNLVGKYTYSLETEITKLNDKDKAQKQKLIGKLQQFKAHTKETYDIIQYNTDDITEIYNLTEEGTPENIQDSLNHLLELKGVIDIRLKTILKRKCTQKIQTPTIVELSKLINMKYNLFLVDTLKPNGTYQSSYYNTPVEYTQEGITQEKPFIEINRTWLFNEFEKLIETIPHYRKEDFTINIGVCGTILNNINNARTFNKNIVELSNIYIKKDTMEIIPKEETTEKYLTIDRLGLTENKGTPQETINLFTYDPSITLDTLTPTNTTEVVRIVKEILIPRQEQDKKEKFLYFIQLLGLMVHGNNDLKILPVFYRSKGNNGKGVLSKIIKKIFGNGVSDIKAKNIDDTFINEVLKRSKHCIINDEIRENDIKDNDSIYKQLTGASGFGGRQIHGGEVDRIEEIPPLFLAGNNIPNVPITDEFKALLKRLNLIKMPNVFKDNANPKLNEYEEVSGTDLIINNDYKGLSQLLSLAINEFKKLDYTGNVRNQLALTPSLKETMSIISESNPLLNFISLYTKKIDINTPKDQWITTKDIRNMFTEWYKLDNKGIEPPEALFGRNNTNIGYALQEIYGKEEVEKRKQKPNNSSNIYCFKLLTEEDKELSQKILIEIHEYNPNNKLHRSITQSTLSVYYLIKGNKWNNEEDILKHLIKEGYTEEDVTSYLQTLDSVDLIEYKEQITL